MSEFMIDDSQESENQVNENIYEYPKEAPHLCYGQSPSELDVGINDACQHYVYFKRLLQLKKFRISEDKDVTKYISIYYYEDPILEKGVYTEKMPPKKGIVIKEVTIYKNENERWTKVIISLDFVPIEVSL